MFTSLEDRQLSTEYERDGYIIRQAANPSALGRIRTGIANIARQQVEAPATVSDSDLLNNIHNYVTVEKLNQFRLQVIQKMNAMSALRQDYFEVARPFLEAIVGNELAMQLRVNLSIQLPGDVSSLLPVHADTWSGDSPYEVVVWVPLVDCYKTKAMYLLGPEHARSLMENFSAQAGQTSEQLYASISEHVKFLDVQYGQILLFDQGFPHGNRVNQESQSRWSMNCRFKGVFTPYGDKKIGEFFEPITLRSASKVGMEYRFPKIN